MSDGFILDLVSKNNMDNDIIDINNKTSLFNYNIIKKNKYTKGDLRYNPIGQINWGNTIRFNIEKDGDLLYGLYIVIKLPKLSIKNINNNFNENNPNENYRIKYSNFIGNVIIEKVSLYINDLLIDEQTGDYMQNYIDLYLSDWNRKSMLNIVNNKPNLKIDSEYIYIPLKFWFCNDVTKPLPIIALQYSNIYIDVKLRTFSECILVLELDNNILYHSNAKHIEVPIEEIYLQAHFLYLELEERKQLGLKEYEILITQSQYKTKFFNNKTNMDIDFKYIIKDLFFFIQPINNRIIGEYFNFTNKTDYPLINNKPINLELWKLESQKHLLNRARLLFNGLERIGWRDCKYFYNMQNHENYKNRLETFIYLYSFNLEPNKFSNNSGCNFSQIENPQLQIEVTNNEKCELKCYATNFNILIIKNGICTLKYL